MYTQVWIKFLPVIRIMLKRAVASPQLLKLNRTDFDKAGGGKKVGFRFTVELANTKVQNKISSPIAKDLVTILQQDPAAAAILSGKDYELDLNPKCELSIRFTSAVQPVQAEEVLATAEEPVSAAE
jgi:acetylglutamate kinase